MEIRSSKKYNYYFINGNIIMFVKKDNLDENMNNDVRLIANHTANTWQKGRKQDELIRNTLQGKLAEDMFDDFISFNQADNRIKYTSYDVFRSDNFEKHAPIDGLLFEDGNAWLNDGILNINNDVTNNDYGKLSNDTRAYLREKRLYTVEIKSSRVPDRDYDGLNLNEFAYVQQQEKLIQNLRKRDFFVYPEFTRTLGRTVHNFEQYCEYVKEMHSEFSIYTGQKLVEKIVEKELETKCTIYTRIFLDWDNSDSVIGYMTGYALGTDFFNRPQIINMPRKNKSENALYYVYPIANTKSLLEIFNDNRIW